MATFESIQIVLTATAVTVTNLKRNGVLVTDAGDVDSFTYEVKAADGTELAAGNLEPIDGTAGGWRGVFVGPATAQDVRVLIEVRSGTSRGRWKRGIRYEPWT